MFALRRNATPSMLSERGRRALLGIVESIEAAQDFVVGLRLDEFSTDRRNLYAVTRCLEIVSEASRRVDAGTRERHPHIAWRQIANAGNVYRHEYDIVSPGMIWRTVQEDLPDLLIVCRAELTRSPGGS